MRPLQDVSGGLPVPVAGTDGKVFGMEIDLEKARQDLRDLGGQDQGSKLEDVLGSGAPAPLGWLPPRALARQARAGALPC